MGLQTAGTYCQVLPQEGPAECCSDHSHNRCHNYHSHHSHRQHRKRIRVKSSLKPLIIATTSASSVTKTGAKKNTKNQNHYTSNTYGHLGKFEEEERQRKRGPQKDVLWAISSLEGPSDRFPQSQSSTQPVPPQLPLPLPLPTIPPHFPFPPPPLPSPPPPHFCFPQQAPPKQQPSQPTQIVLPSPLQSCSRQNLNPDPNRRHQTILHLILQLRRN